MGPTHQFPPTKTASHIMCKYPFSGSLVLLLPLFHRFASLVSFQTHSDLARTHTHTQVYFSSNSRDARLSHSNQHVRKISDSLFGGEKKNTYHAVFTIKAGVVSFQNVALLKFVRPVILDVLGEFLIRAVGCGNSQGHYQKLHFRPNSSFIPINIYLKSIQFMMENSKETHILVLVVLLITTDFPLGSTL